MTTSISQLAASPCSTPKLGLEEFLAANAKLGFGKFEIFTGWAGAAFDIDGDPQSYVNLAAAHGMRFSSLHLPPIGEDLDITRAVAAARFAAAVGAPIVLYKAAGRDAYIAAAGAFLEAVDDLPVTPVIQNHFGTPVTSLDDFRAVLDGIGDPRMKALLEVGHFHAAGVRWPDGAELLAGRIAMVHVKDMIDRQSVPFGTGEVDLPGLFEHMSATGYTGDYVLEMEVADKENTLTYVGEAIEYLRAHCGVEG